MWTLWLCEEVLAMFGFTKKAKEEKHCAVPVQEHWNTGYKTRMIKSTENFYLSMPNLKHHHFCNQQCWQVYLRINHTVGNLQFLCSVKVKIWRPNSSLARSVHQSITSECKQPSPRASDNQQETTTTTQQSNISTKIVVLSWISSTVSWGSTLRSPPPTISITKNMEGNDAKYNTTFTSARILRNHLKSVHCPSYTQDGESGRWR